MKQPGQIYRINAYFTNKIKQAERVQIKLLEAVDGLTRLNYEKGTRDGDFSLREKLKELKSETEGHYRAIKSFGSGKIGETGVFKEILSFYGGHFLDEFQLEYYLSSLRKEIINQENRDKHHNVSKAGGRYERKINIFVKDLERQINEWENNLRNTIVPLIVEFINEINDIVLFVQINSMIDSLIEERNIFALKGNVFQDFKQCIAVYVSYYLKNREIFMSESEIIDLVFQNLDDMGFKTIILRTSNINQAKLNDIVTHIIREYGLEEIAADFKQTGSGPGHKIGEQEKLTFYRDREITKLLEKLCFVEQTVKEDPDDADEDERGLAAKPGGQYLFYSPGTFDLTLKYIAEYLRDGLIFIIDWLNMEIHRNPHLSGVLDPMLLCMSDINNFIGAYKRALEISSIKSNRAESGLLSSEKQFVTKKMAGELIEIIIETSTNVQDGLNHTALNAANVTARGGMLSKKLKILQQSFNDTIEKIKKGLEKIGYA